MDYCPLHPVNSVVSKGDQLSRSLLVQHNRVHFSTNKRSYDHLLQVVVQHLTEHSTRHALQLLVQQKQVPS